jgi:hypothetical protein
MQKEKIIGRGKKMFIRSNETVVGRDKIKCSTPKSWVEVILKICQMSIPIKY